MVLGVYLGLETLRSFLIMLSNQLGPSYRLKLFVEHQLIYNRLSNIGSEFFVPNDVKCYVCKSNFLQPNLFIFGNYYRKILENISTSIVIRLAVQLPFNGKQEFHL